MVRSRKRCILKTAVVAFAVACRAPAQCDINFFENASNTIEYKKAGSQSLKCLVFKPSNWKSGDSRPCLVSIFGGGWRQRCPPELQPYWGYFSSQGYVVVVPDYRIASASGPEKVETHCLPDVKAAFRWVRKSASTLGIDPDRIIGFGSSAGGHLAACAAIIDGFEHDDEDLTVSSKPDLLALLYPVLVVSPSAITNCGSCWEFFGACFATPNDVSPANFVGAGNPPTLILVGTNDFYLPGDNTFKTNAQKEGVAVLMEPLEGLGHDFACSNNTGGNGSQIVKDKCREFFDTHGFGPSNKIVALGERTARARYSAATGHSRPPDFYIVDLAGKKAGPQKDRSVTIGEGCGLRIVVRGRAH
jgi:acetyl esterase